MIFPVESHPRRVSDLKIEAAGLEEMGELEIPMEESLPL
jgi:hypothetical protein